MKLEHTPGNSFLQNSHFYLTSGINLIQPRLINLSDEQELMSLNGKEIRETHFSLFFDALHSLYGFDRIHDLSDVYELYQWSFKHYIIFANEESLNLRLVIRNSFPLDSENNPIITKSASDQQKLHEIGRNVYQRKCLYDRAQRQNTRYEFSTFHLRLSNLATEQYEISIRKKKTAFIFVPVKASHYTSEIYLNLPFQS